MKKLFLLLFLFAPVFAVMNNMDTAQLHQARITRPQGTLPGHARFDANGWFTCGVKDTADSAAKSYISDTTKCKPPLARRADTATYIDTIPGTHVVSGSGTQYFLPRFGVDGKTLGNSIIQQNSAGTQVGIGIAPASTHVVDINATGTAVYMGVGDINGSGPLLYYGYDGTNIYINSRDNYPLALYTNNTKWLTLSTAGLLSVGDGITTAAISQSARTFNLISTTAAVAISRISADINTAGPTMEFKHFTTQANADAGTTDYYWDIFSNSTGLNFRSRQGSPVTPMIVSTTGVMIGTTAQTHQVVVQDATTPTWQNYQLMLCARTDYAVNNWTGIEFGISATSYGEQYAKGGIIWQGLDGYNRGQFLLCAQNQANTATAGTADARLIVKYDGTVTMPGYTTNGVAKFTGGTGLIGSSTNMDSGPVTWGGYIAKSDSTAGGSSTHLLTASSLRDTSKVLSTADTVKVPCIKVDSMQFTGGTYIKKNGVFTGNILGNAATLGSTNFAGPTEAGKNGYLVRYTGFTSIDYSNSTSNEDTLRGTLLIDSLYAVNTIHSARLNIGAGAIDSTGVITGSLHVSGNSLFGGLINTSGGLYSSGTFTQDNGILNIHSAGGGSLPCQLKIGWVNDYALLEVYDDAVNDFVIRTKAGAGGTEKEMFKIKQDQTGVFIPNGTLDVTGLATANTGIVYAKATTGELGATNIAAGTILMGSSTAGVAASNMSQSSSKILINGAGATGYLNVFGLTQDAAQTVVRISGNNASAQLKALDFSLVAGTPQWVISTAAAGTDASLGFGAGTSTPQMVLLTTGLLGIGCTPATTLAIAGTVSLTSVQTAAAAGTLTPTCSRIAITGAAGTYTLAAGTLPAGTMIYIYEDGGTTGCIVTGYYHSITLNTFTGIWAIKDASGNWCLQMPAL